MRALGLPHVLDAFARTNAVRRAIGALADRPSASLDRLARAALDVCSHRLDAWITSLATRRLAQLRAATPSGVHVGAYAWVEDLRRRPAPVAVADPPAGEAGPLFSDPDNAGFVHGPSLAHAAAGAVLRSGHLSHAAAGQADGPLAIDLSSDRVRTALWLLDGVRQGQPIGALLGYRLERGLHERSGAGLELDRFIRPLRALEPLVAAKRETVGETPADVEAVAATNVVDGLALWRHFEADATSVEAALGGATNAERAAVREELAALGEAIDAIGDVLLAESTFQLVNGSPSRAAATLDALGSGLAAPPEPEVTATPRPGFAHTYRVLSLVGGAAAAAPGWERGAERPRRLAEPRLERWAAAQLGPAAAIRAAVRVTAAGGAAQVREVDLDAAGLCALDLVHDGAGAAGHSAVESWLVDHAARTSPGAGATVELVRRDDPDWPGDAWPADVLALDDALALAAALADVLATARPATGADLAAPGSAPPPIDAAELAARAERAVRAFGDAAAALRAALDAAGASSSPSRAQVGAVRAALATLAGFGVAGAHEAARTRTGAQVDDPESAGSLLAAAQLVAPHVSALADGLGGADASPLDDLHALFGERFPIAALFDAPDRPGLDAALAAGARPEFLGGDPTAPLAWLQRAGRVREVTGRLALTLAYGDPADAHHALAVAQLPLAERWVALGFEGAEPPAAATSLLLHGGLPPGPLAGLLVDEWVEVVPARRVTTGVGFHFDEPGARAPQAVLLAVHPQPGQPWSLEVLADVVAETADLARIRAVGPEEMPWVGRLAPALYFADNRLGDTAHVDFADLVQAADP